MAGPTRYDREQDRRDAERDRQEAARNDAQAARDRGQDQHARETEWDQRETDEGQDERIDDAADRLAELDRIQLEPAEAAKSPGAEGASPAQRLRITIPTVLTDLSMGAKGDASTVRAGFPNRAGFGVATDGDIFMMAKERVCIEAEKDLLVQAQKSAWFGGNDVSVVASPANTIISGGGGLVLTGGATIAWQPNLGTASDPLPAQPNWSGAWGDPAGKLSTLSGVFDTLTGVALVARGVILGKVGVPSTKATSAATWAGVIAAGVSAAGVVNGLAGSHGTGALGGTTIHGTAGVVVNTIGTMGLYAGVGATLAAGGGVAVLSPIAVGITGGCDVDIAAGKIANLVSGGELSLISKGDAVLDSNTGQLSLGGKDVAIASHANNGIVTINSGMIAATATVSAHLSSGDTSLVLEPARGGLTSLGSMNVEGSKVSISALEGEIHLGSTTEVAIRAGSFFSYVKPDMAVLGMAPGADLPAPPAPPTLEVPPPQPPMGNRAIRRWCDLATKVGARNAKKLKAHAKAEEDWLDNLKVAQVGVIVKKSGVEIVCDGHKLTLDSGKIKTASMVLTK